MPETTDTAKEIVKIRRDIQDIKHSQDADMQLNKSKYLQLVNDVINGNPLRIRVFLAVDGLRSRREIQDIAKGSQVAVWRTIDLLEGNNLIVQLEETKGGSQIYGKPRWVRTLRIDDYVRNKWRFPEEEEPKPGNSTDQSSS
jgi:seryl-tRNA(Sec) selenium transferase